LVLAQTSGATEIEIDHLLAALDPEFGLLDPVVPPEGPFFPVPKEDMALSPGAAAAIRPLGDISTIPLDVFRSVLLAARRQGAN
jgi:hypothetical protein